MHLSWLFARRYLFSRKSSSAINILSWISVSGIAIGSLGLILVLSVFNGFRSLVISLYNAFSPEFVIEASVGKSFIADSAFLADLQAIPGIKSISRVIEENALLIAGDRQAITTIKGVDDAYVSVTAIDQAVVDGSFLVRDSISDYAVLGLGVAQTLGVHPQDPFALVSIYIPKKNITTWVNPLDAFHREIVRPTGIFSIQADIDNKYVFVSLDLARRLTGYTQQITALEISVTSRANVSAVASALAQRMPPHLVVKNRFQQNETLYRVMNTEKWAVYAILTLILLVASFNMVGSLSMLVIEKKRDISMLKALGAHVPIIRKIFLFEGLLIALLGLLIGMALALVLVWLQQQFSLLRMSGTFVIDAYPVEVHGSDLLLVLATVVAIALLAAWYPARQAAISPIQIEKE
ncbi:MAG: FtsX-like permease family protein [Chitinophagales bacterium]|nr:FtsX-like permease family protein [Chitinophagales bacterium]MDW8427141.1 FtsX-like permease family protein [Chitinophagales bacterium]